ncbi:hypothetical protein [Acinetobacter phage AB1I1M-1]
MILPEFVNLKLLKESINVRHHAMERFYDVEEANKDHKENMELLERLSSNVPYDDAEDIAKAKELISNPY